MTFAKFLIPFIYGTQISGALGVPLTPPVTRHPPPPPLPCIRMRPTRSSQRSPHAPSFFPFTRVVLAISIAAMVLGQVSAFSPDYVKAKVAAARLFKLFDRVSAIDSSSEDGNKPVRINTPVIISTSTHSDCCAFAPKILCKLPKNTISRNCEIRNKRLLLCAKEPDVQNASSWSQMSQSIMVASARGIVVPLYCKRTQSSESMSFLCKKLTASRLVAQQLYYTRV